MDTSTDADYLSMTDMAEAFGASSVVYIDLIASHQLSLNTSIRKASSLASHQHNQEYPNAR